MSRGVNMDVGLYIKQLRTQKGLSQEELGKIVGVQRAAVQKWESGATQNLKRTTIQKLASYFDVSPIMFVDGNAPASSKFDNLPEPNITEDYTSFPVIGEVAAGYEHVAIEDWEGDVVDIPNQYLQGHNKSDFFVLKIKGDSMIPLYHEGDKVFILKQSSMDYSGQIGVVIYGDDKGTLKRVEYAQGENWMRLVPLNLNHPIIKIENEDLEHCRVIGIPKLLIREIKD